MGPSGPFAPMVARWSKSQRWSKPPSSAIFQIARSSSMVIHCPEALIPKRSGWMVVIRTRLVKPHFAYLDDVVVGGAEALWRRAEVPDLSPVLAHVGGVLVGGGRLFDRGLARRAHEVVADLIAVEVELDVRVCPEVADLDPVAGVDQERLAVPEEPDGHGLWLAVGAGRDQPDHYLLLEARLGVPVHHSLVWRGAKTGRLGAR